MLLARDSRSSYKDIASAVGISSNAAKERINKMVLNGIIQGFFSTYKSCNIWISKRMHSNTRRIGKPIKEQDILNRVRLVGDIFVFAKQLGGALTFV
jgi:hypothetical protein